VRARESSSNQEIEELDHSAEMLAGTGMFRSAGGTKMRPGIDDPGRDRRDMSGGRRKGQLTNLTDTGIVGDQASRAGGTKRRVIGAERMRIDGSASDQGPGRIGTEITGIEKNVRAREGGTEVNRRRVRRRRKRVRIGKRIGAVDRGHGLTEINIRAANMGQRKNPDETEAIRDL
jgi:hypothetical protein